MGHHSVSLSLLTPKGAVGPQIPLPPPVPEVSQLHVPTAQVAHPSPSGLLTKIAGACLVEEQTHGDIPACGPVHSGVAGLLASQRIPGEISI